MSIEGLVSILFAGGKNAPSLSEQTKRIRCPEVRTVAENLKGIADLEWEEVIRKYPSLSSIAAVHMYSAINLLEQYVDNKLPIEDFEKALIEDLSAPGESTEPEELSPSECHLLMNILESPSSSTENQPRSNLL